MLKENQINPKYFNKTLLQSAFDFIGSLDNIEMILCGNSSLETFQKTVDAHNNISLVNNYDVYIQALEEYKNNHIIPCINCNRCTYVCPSHLPIYAYIRLYNLALNDTKYFNAFDILKGSPDEPNHLCEGNNCRACVDECPLGIDIPNLFFDRIFELRT